MALVTETISEAGSPVLGHVCTAAQAGTILPAYVMPETELNALKDAWASVTPPEEADLAAHLEVALHCAKYLPLALEQRIRAFADEPGTSGALLLRNFPFDSICGHERQSSYAEASALAVAGLLGRLCKNADQRGGAVMQHLRPVREDADKQLGSCCGELYWHTEDAHIKENCHFIVLFCLRGDPEAVTFVSRVEPESLPPKTRSLLEETAYSILPDESFDQASTGLQQEVVLAKENGRQVVRFEPVYVKYRSQAHHQALMTLNEHINERAMAACLTAGDVIIIDNRAAVHARSAFKPRFDGNDRWLLRVTTR